MLRREVVTGTTILAIFLCPCLEFSVKGRQPHQFYGSQSWNLVNVNIHDKLAKIAKTFQRSCREEGFMTGRGEEMRGNDLTEFVKVLF